MIRTERKALIPEKIRLQGEMPAVQDSRVELSTYVGNRIATALTRRTRLALATALPRVGVQRATHLQPV